MREFWGKVLRFGLDCLGQPATLGQMLKENDKLRYELAGEPRSVASSEVVRWQDWGPGELLGWKAAGGEYCSYHHTIQALASINSTEIVEHWQCEIQDVVGLCASKAELRDFSSLDEMAESRVQYLVGEVTQANLQASLGWQEIRILHRDNTSDHLAIHQWDGRVFLMNSGGSHHFVAGRYLAARLGVEVPVLGTLRVHRLSKPAVSSLINEYEVFALADDPEAFMMFMDAMRTFRAGFLWCDLPQPYEGGRAVFLPRDDAKSMQVATLLHQTGHADLGAHLLTLSGRALNVPGVERHRRHPEPTA
ncbi:hypothetical protein IIE18_11520 [Pseudomonas sp. V1]|uniref:DUF6685 family protein n=1 Tax=Pseudomonas arcuscaelestis TaxID=2710591 RepID=UPI00193F2B67|nr:DUF6685 family protein [Pseudomonas arcuscaelestis]MBM3105770.1 hypothetical protein [Pseudomonas arcuscaelestis]